MSSLKYKIKMGELLNHFLSFVKEELTLEEQALLAKVIAASPGKEEVIMRGIQEDRVYRFDNEEEFTEEFNELADNPDFKQLGTYNDIEDIDDDLEYQGFLPREIAGYHNARYGRVIEVLEFNGTYEVFCGVR